MPKTIHNRMLWERHLRRNPAQEHVAHVRASDGRRYATYRKTVNEFGDGIDVLYGIRPQRRGEGPRGGRTEVVSLYFNPARFTPSEARDWLDEYDYGQADLEEADRENPTRTVFEDIAIGDYPSFLKDFDDDGIPDVDDPHPYTPGDTESIEAVRFSNEFRKIMQVRERFEDAMYGVLRDLKEMHVRAYAVEGRTKTPYSIINKLRRKRLSEPFIEITPDMVGDVLTKGLTDIAGTRIILPAYAQVRQVARKIEGGALGRVLEKENHYQLPGPYRAVHYLVRRDGLPVEVQVKTARMAAIADAAHTLYKTGALDEGAMEEVAALAQRADLGDEEAAAQVDDLLASEERLTERLMAVRHNPAAGTFLGAMAAGLGALAGVKLLRTRQSA